MKEWKNGRMEEWKVLRNIGDEIKKSINKQTQT